VTNDGSEERGYAPDLRAFDRSKRVLHVARILREERENAADWVGIEKGDLTAQHFSKKAAEGNRKRRAGLYPEEGVKELADAVGTRDK
jgi:hypothetical protein